MYKRYRIYLANGEYLGRYLMNKDMLADALGGYSQFTILGDCVQLV